MTFRLFTVTTCSSAGSVKVEFMMLAAIIAVALLSALASLQQDIDGTLFAASEGMFCAAAAPDPEGEPLAYDCDGGTEGGQQDE